MLARTRLGLGAGLAAMTAATTLLMLAVPATAVTLPAWDTDTTPTTSSTCTITTLASDVTHGYVRTYADSGLPTVTAVEFGHGSTYVLAPGTTQIPVRALATETCSGVSDIRIALTRDTSVYLPFTSMAFDTTDAFHASVSEPVALTTTYAGIYRASFGYVVRRYDTFQLGVDFALVSSTVGSGGTFVSGPWSSKKLYLLLETTLTAAASRASVKKGRSVTFSTVLKKASGASYANAAGEKVLFQTRIGKGKWVTRTTRTTSSTGAASYSFKPTVKMTWRWVHANVLTGTYTAASVSAVKSIKVT